MSKIKKINNSNVFYKLKYIENDFFGLGESTVYLIIEDMDYLVKRFYPTEIYKTFDYLDPGLKERVLLFMMELFTEEEVKEVRKSLKIPSKLIKEEVKLPIKDIKSIKIIRDIFKRGTSTTLDKNKVDLPFNLCFYADKEAKRAIESSRFIFKNKK